MPSKIIPSIFQQYGRLTALCVSPYNNEHWIFVCQCGVFREIYHYNVRKRNTQSCGCLQKESCVNNRFIKNRTTHGLTRTPEHKSWAGMIQRCTNPNEHCYPRYGGRGITYCERWNSFENFYADLGPRPTPKKAYSLDRINVNGNYEPGNCRWATIKQQARNKRTNATVIIDGKPITILEVAEKYNIAYSALYQRIKKLKKPIEEAIAMGSSQALRRRNA
jgi:hypothetical protein